MEFAEIYLDFTSASIKGDADPEEYKDHIELFDWSWGAKVEEAADEGGGDTENQAKGKAISFSKPVDRASTAMLSYLESGGVIPKATLVLVQRTQQNLMVRVELKEVLLMSYDLEVESDDDEVVLSEDWTMNYKEIKIQYKGRKDSGDVRGKVSALSTIDFVLTAQSGRAMDKPERKEKAPESSGKLDKDEVFKLIEEFMKKNKNKITTN